MIGEFVLQNLHRLADGRQPVELAVIRAEKLAFRIGDGQFACPEAEGLADSFIRQIRTAKGIMVVNAAVIGKRVFECGKNISHIERRNPALLQRR